MVSYLLLGSLLMCYQISL
ncbi:hypothetical protein VCHENC02_1692A, partial [Vibrio harveyi]